MRYIRFATAAILAAVPFSNAYGVNLPKPVSNVKATSPSISRQNFLAVMAGGLSAGLISNEAWAKDADSKGTKKDPVFEACLSQCMYDCTKPKGDEQKSRKECLPDCKTQCAKTDAQLMKGTPKAQNVDMGV